MDRIIGQITLTMAAVAGAAVAGLMAFTFFDIVSRPLGIPGYRGIIEISYLSMIGAAYFGLPLVCIKKEHIVVDLATHYLPPGVKQKIDGFWILCIALFLLVQVYFVGVSGFEEHFDGDRSEAMQWSPILFAMPAVIGGSIAGLVGLIYAFRNNQHVEMADINDV